MRVNRQVLCVIAALTCAIAQPPPTSDFILENVAIPVRDGVLLRADILRPKGGGPFPVLVYRTPYGKHFAQKEYTIFRRAVQRGYAIVIQDVRGRYASDGEFRPYENEGHDGYDNIAPDVRARKNLPGAKTADEAIAGWKQAAPRMLNSLPLKQLADLRGVAPYYYDWLSHPAEDPWWDWAELRNKYSRVHAAVLN